MKVIDLFSGLGGFSQAFIDRGHEVTRYDNNERFKDIPFTIIEDVRNLTPGDLQGADIILAGFPCQHFSYAANRIHWPKGTPTDKTRDWIEFLEWTVQLIKDSEPRYWILENPRGFMRRILGRPSMKTAWCAWGTRYKKPTDLWGVLPPIDWRMAIKWEKSQDRAGVLAQKRDLAARALIPYAFSLAVCLAMEGKSKQMTLFERPETARDSL